MAALQVEDNITHTNTRHKHRQVGKTDCSQRLIESNEAEYHSQSRIKARIYECFFYKYQQLINKYESINVTVFVFRLDDDSNWLYW